MDRLRSWEIRFLFCQQITVLSQQAFKARKFWRLENN